MKWHWTILCPLLDVSVLEFLSVQYRDSADGWLVVIQDPESLAWSFASQLQFEDPLHHLADRIVSEDCWLEKMAALGDCR